MEKPFDVAILLEKAKAAGLPMLEEDAKIMTKVIFEWLKESLKLEPFSMISGPIVDKIEEIVLLAEDNISPA